MEPNQTPNQNLTPPPMPQMTPAPQVAAPPPVKKDYKEMLSGMWGKVPPILRKVLLVFGIIFGLLIVLAVVVSMGQKVNNKTVERVATPTPAVNTKGTPVPIEIRNPSRYATDSGLLKIEEEVKELDLEMGSVDLKELNLRPPDIQFKINFEE